jgi:hypothetical protein
MTQPELFPRTRPEQPVSVPYARGSKTSKAGAIKASRVSGKQCLTLLGYYESHGPLTDAEAAKLMTVERSTINARRNALMRAKLVVEVGTRKNPTSGILNTTYGVK